MVSLILNNNLYKILLINHNINNLLMKHYKIKIINNNNLLIHYNNMQKIYMKICKLVN